MLKYFEGLLAQRAAKSHCGATLRLRNFYALRWGFAARCGAGLSPAGEKVIKLMGLSLRFGARRHFAPQKYFDALRCGFAARCGAGLSPAGEKVYKTNGAEPPVWCTAPLCT